MKNFEHSVAIEYLRFFVFFFLAFTSFFVMLFDVFY